MSREWEDKPQTEILFTRDSSVKGNVPNIYKELIKLNSKKADNLFQKYVKDLNRELTREDKQMTIIWKDVSYHIREMQIKMIPLHTY